MESFHRQGHCNCDPGRVTVTVTCDTSRVTLQTLVCTCSAGRLAGDTFKMSETYNIQTDHQIIDGTDKVKEPFPLAQMISSTSGQRGRSSLLLQFDYVQNTGTDLFHKRSEKDGGQQE